MPVSPQDFELYSRMTGAPMPTDAMSRMQMAPDVYNFTKSFARKPNILEKTGNLVKNIGRGAVMALGAPLVAASEAENARMQEQLRNQGDIAESEAATTSDPVQTSEELQVEKEKTKRKTIEMEGRKDLVRMANTGVQQTNLNPVQMDDYQSLLNPTTADSYGQDYVPNQTATNVVDRKMEQGSQIADSPPNIAEVLSESQDSQPLEKMVGGADKEVIAKFRTTNNLDKALKGVFKLGQQEEELVDDSTIVQSASPLNDHVDTEPGENAGNVPSNKFNQVSGTNTSSTENLNDFYKEMRRMDTMERNKEAIDQIVEQAPTPSEKQVGRSPNELAGKDQETFLSLTGNPSQQRRIEADQARSRVEQKTAYKQRMAGMQTPLTDQYYPSDVPRTDIQVGGMVDRKTGLGKSVGISRTPLNGDTKIGFNIMNDPRKPTEVGTFDFIAPPETMESLESREEGDLGSMSVGKLFNIARQRKQGFQGM